MTSEIKVDTISENTSANGVTIDGLTIKDGNIIGDVALAGTTPTFTIGDAGAEDAALIFDGNAQDFYVALDDSADDLVIGLGNTIGTTPIMSFDENKDVVIHDGGLSITTADNTDTLTLISTDADALVGPNLNFYRNSSSPADGDLMGQIKFTGESAGSGIHTYGSIVMENNGVTDGQEQGKIKFNISMPDGALANVFNIDRTEICINEDSEDLDFRVESNGLTHALFVDGGNDRVGIGTSSPDMLFEVQGSVSVGGGSDEKLQQWNVGSDNCKMEVEYLDASGNRGFGFGPTSQQNLNLKTHDTNRLTIRYDGLIGIGALPTSRMFAVTTPASYSQYTVDFNNASSSAPYGIFNRYTGAAPDSGSDYHFLVCDDTSATRLRIESDGDVKNHDNSYGALSDERIKQDIRDSNSQWNDIKAVKVRNFKKKDDVRQYGDNAWEQIGVIAQELEVVSPKLIRKHNPSSFDILSNAEFGTLYEDGDSIPEDKAIGDVKEIKDQVKSVNYSILYMKAIKALQEAMARIEALENA